MRRALTFVGRLIDIPGSRYRAMMRGDRSFIDWGHAEDIAAASHDDLVVSIFALGGVDAGHDMDYPRPKRPAPATQAVVQARTIAEFDEIGFMHMISG